MGEPETRFGSAGAVRIAYQVSGGGSFDLVLVPLGGDGRTDRARAPVQVAAAWAPFFTALNWSGFCTKNVGSVIMIRSA